MCMPVRAGSGGKVVARRCGLAPAAWLWWCVVVVVVVVVAVAGGATPCKGAVGSRLVAGGTGSGADGTGSGAGGVAKWRLVGGGAAVCVGANC